MKGRLQSDSQYSADLTCLRITTPQNHLFPAEISFTFGNEVVLLIDFAQTLDILVEVFRFGCWRVAGGILTAPGALPIIFDFQPIVSQNLVVKLCFKLVVHLVLYSLKQ